MSLATSYACRYGSCAATGGIVARTLYVASTIKLSRAWHSGWLSVEHASCIQLTTDGMAHYLFAIVMLFGS